MRLALPFFLLLVAACSSPVGKCTPSTCPGCCDARGECAAGNSNLECGASAAACTSCQLGQNCVLGQCSSTVSQGGGGGAASGGGTGGGTGGGAVTGGGTGGGATTGGGTGGGGATTGGGGGTTGGGGGSALFPNVMLLVDTSGSMLLPMNPAAAACPAGCGTSTNPCPGTCPTRISELRTTVANWLAVRGSTLRVGLTTYPSGPLCELPAAPAVALPAATTTDVGTGSTLSANASQVSVALQARTPQGGTPTGASIAVVGALPGLNANDGRADYVVLLTDGLPNCNSTNPNSLCACASSCTATQVSACQCTTSTCTTALCSIGCLDSAGTIGAVSSLAAAGIKTIVVGFGADTAAGTAPAVLDAMARAGGAPRSCPNGTTAECGGGVCLSNRTCEKAFYGAAGAAELQAVLDALF